MSTPVPRTLPDRTARARWQAEVDSAALYHALADLEAGSPRSQVYRRLAGVEGRHAEFWAGQSPGPTPRVSWRTGTLITLARRFGPALILATVVGLEDIGGQEYGHTPQAQGTGMPAEERSHARLLREIASPVAGQVGGAAVAGLEGRHRTPGGNALRAAVLGANDGLVSNLSLVLGVAGADLPGRAGLPGTPGAPFSGAPLPIRFGGRYLVRNDRVPAP